ncbi:hypothetical protein BDN72DRAFT_837130 [Pluteus cervinus]|uniref:Uncharacterized protein n=1 Tax=Pluteus cervinus TaxID=181527 RepID=A0ACD3B2V3_9AGAR|nr:hypothetical protein BDN72DRAFT_837130 [Pluteus cervinus]
MPGPGKAKGKKSKSKSTSTSSPLPPEAYIGDIDNAEGWYLIVNILCGVFELPDLTTRSGLKKVHANFESVYKQLDSAYRRYSENDKMAGGIVGIYAKMCSDTILRNKLISNGLLDKIFPLLERPACRHLALQSLGTISHNDGGTARSDLAKQAPILLKLVEKHPEDAKTIDLAITTLAHSVSALVGGNHAIPVKTLQSSHIPQILEVTANTIKQPNATPHLVVHAVDLFATTTLNASSICGDNPSVINCLVSGLRSSDWVTKCTCLGGIIRLHRYEAEPDQRSLDPQKFIAAISRRFPDHIVDVLMDYGMTRTETWKTALAARNFQEAIMACVQDHDLYSLGLKLADLILDTEFSIGDGYFQTRNPRTGKMEMAGNMGLPFTMYMDALPHCAKAIRAKGKREELNLADVLEIKFHVARGRVPSAIEVATKALERSPEYAYFYYAMTLCANNVDGLCAAKKGLKCKQKSPFIHFQMLQRAVEHAGDLGLKTLQDAPKAGDKKWEEGIAFLMSAYEDAKTYVEEAPPDNRHMKNVLYWLIILTVTINDEINPDLQELKDYLERLKLADDVSTFIGVPPPKTNLRLAMQTIVQRFAEAIKEFGDIIAQKTAPKQAPEPINAEKAGDDLAAWLENLRTDDGSEEPEMHFVHPNITMNHVGLYRCSWCSNPSAVLRKCSGCAKTRYCDSGCQRSHWSEHKRACVASSVST